MLAIRKIRLPHDPAAPIFVDMSNKELVQRIFDALAVGDRRPFRDAIAEDFTWTIIGSTAWSGTYAGREVVARELIAPLFARFSGTYTNTAERIIAEGEYVVVQCRGRVTTTSGEPYNNTYCHVFRVTDGQLRELTEYCDTDLVARVLSDPGGPDTPRRSS